MEKKIIKIIILLLLVTVLSTHSLAITDRILINDETFSFVSKEKMITDNFDKQYTISNEYNNENKDLNETITNLTKKTTYLLLGEPNLSEESSENYYKRHNDYLKLRYNPQIPKDENTMTGLDEKSQEYKDDILSGISVPGMFLKLNELEIKYNSYGEIRISQIDDSEILSIITLSNVQMKKQDTENPMNYSVMQTDLTIYYYFKKLDNEYKLLYLYGEINDDIEKYFNNNDNEKLGSLFQNENYNSELSDIYNFSKMNAITDNTLNTIYDENKNSIVFLNSIYNMGTVASANGFFISEGLIITTYSYIEKSLQRAQDILISDCVGNAYELDGIVTIDIENDIAILKVKNKNSNYIKLQDVNELKKEDAVITLNTKTGVGLTTSKGIIISLDKNIYTSLPIIEEARR